MTPNWSAALVITLLVVFVIVSAMGMAMGVYAAKQLKKAEDKSK
jgi:cell division protein FtsL